MAHPKESELVRQVAALRRFNRFYTQKIGVLGDGLFESPFSLAESRVLYELANREHPVASELCRDLGLDPGYLSRILARFQRDRLIERRPSSSDGRRILLMLTRKGRETFRPMDRASRAAIARLLAPLSEQQRRRLSEAAESIERLLGTEDVTREPFVLRPYRPGDMGWVVHRHAALYAREYGFDETFEALVAEIAAKFIRNFDAKRERCWIAEREGEILGSVFLVRQSASVAKLRLLLVEPEARGLGIGKRLVEECVRFARDCRYRKIVLWTNSILTAARHLYENAGFTLTHEEAHHSFGQDLVGETWELRL
jgi:DNA-binding MarR family transcriptional regulator/N-acetylglutamate synthase-like GNAT family acetyltransferase